MKHNEQEIFYVGIRDPIEIRRSLLESSKDVVHTLQRFERFKEVRKEKSEALKEMKTTIGQVKKLINQLKSALPESELRVKLGQERTKLETKKMKKQSKASKAKPKIVSQPKVSSKDLTELEKLEAELSAIEGKLSGLL